MANNHDPRCRQCRREGMKLYLKGDKCYGPKCTLDRTGKDNKTRFRDKPPGWGSGAGQTGMYQKKLTEYGVQLREKQKLRRVYRVLENQFHNYYKEAVHRPGVTGENLFQLLELRLDNVVFRLGIGSSRAHARQLVSHRHFDVNGKRVNIASYRLKPGDVISIHDSKQTNDCIKEARERVAKHTTPVWMELNRHTLEGRVLSIPHRSEIDTDIREQLIVEFYSR
ncbi:MAG: 30S ribosomal protein S4 [Armatimonadetes bacterium]|nr:30S ribosomal protein S4 [Armatimonadota bacterium]